MSIFDIFTFKTDFKAIFNSEVFSEIKNKINEEIKDKIKQTIPGQEKMDAVVANVVAFINSKIHSKNKIVQWIIDKVLIVSVRAIAQAVYNDLKEVVKGL